MRDGKRFPGENFWVEQQSWLKDCGYKLRSRYQPDWVPSWKKPVETTFLGREDAVVADVCDLYLCRSSQRLNFDFSSIVIYWTRNATTALS
jgi:hypothetical protein